MRAEAAGQTADRRRLGRRRPAASSSSPTPSSRPAPQAIAELRGLGLDPGAAHRRQPPRRPGRRRDGRHRPTSIAEVLPGDKVDVVQRLQERGPGRRHGRRRRQRRRRPRPGRPRHRHGHRHRRRHRGQRPHPRPRRPARGRRRHPLSRRTLRTIKGNLFWAFAYNVAAIPLAAVRAAQPDGRRRGRWRSRRVFVVTNSLRLRRFTGRKAAEVTAETPAAAPRHPAHAKPRTRTIRRANRRTKVSG